MASIGKLTVYADDGTTAFGAIEFFNLNFPGVGFPIRGGIHQIDPINAMGVNFTRYRIVRDDAQEFQLVGQTDAATFDAATQAADIVRTFKGHLATLTFTAAGVEYIIEDYFFILDALSVPMPGEVVSANLSVTDPKALAVSTFTLKYAGAALAV